MKRNTSSWVVIGMITAIGFGVGAHQWRRMHEIETTHAEIERQRMAALGELRRWQARTSAAEQARPALQTALAAAQPAKNAATADQTKPAPGPSYAERIQKDPAFQLLDLASNRAQLLATYGALFRKLGLSPEQISQFQEIAFRLKESDMDLQSVMKMKHLTWEDPVIKKMRQEGQDEFAAAGRALLGEAGFKSLQGYERTEELRQMVAGWAGGAVVVLREPLTAQQGEELVQIMANASTSFRQGSGVDPNEPGYWSAVEAEARKILSPAQLQLLTTMEPPLPMGARFQTQFYRKVEEALEADKNPVAEAKPRGS